MSKHSLLLVDGDARSLRVLEVSLRKAGFTVTPAASVQDAVDKLELHPPDLIISETTFPDGDGFELRRRVRAVPEWAEIPFVFLTAESAIEHKIRGLELGVDDYLTKPIYIKEIVTRIHILLQKRQRVRFEERHDGRTRFAGRVADMPVVDVIQTVEISRKSGVIQFVGERGHHAAIYFRDGKVIDAEAGSLQAEDAVYRLLTWNEGEFEVEFRTVRRREVITTSAQGLLMEGMRRLDEWSRLLEQLPALGHRFEVDAAELSTRLGDVPDDNNRILRLIDGKRSLLEVIDASDVGDLECLQAISRLYFEGMLVDVDHSAPVDRSIGAPRGLVEVGVPASAAPVAESGPTVAPAPAEAGGPVIAANASASAAASARPASEPASVVAAAVEMTSSDVHERAAPSAAPDALEQSAARVQSATPDAPPIDARDESSPEPAPTPLLGAYRPSSLMLIDAAVAAAEAIEPSLFDDPPTAIGGAGALAAAPVETAAAADTAAVGDSAVPHEIEADEPSDNFEGRDVTATPPFDKTFPILELDAFGRAQPVRREDSGLRMIGSLGRDRASASGEVVPTHAEPSVTTARELVTIMPRRATRELPELPLQPPPKVAPPAEPPRFSEPPAPRGQGPGAVAIAMLTLAGVLAGMTVYLRLRPNKPIKAAPASVIDAGSAPSSIDLPPDAAAAASPPVDAGPLVDRAPEAAVLASRPVDGGLLVPPDAASAPPRSPPAGSDAAALTQAEQRHQANALIEQARAALDHNDFDRALDAVDASLKLRHTVRGYLLRATVLQKLQRVDEALADIDHAMAVTPEYAPAWAQRGRTLWMARRYDEARAAYRHFLELDPTNRDAPAVRNLLAIPP